jgi:hypothetical protein
MIMTKILITVALFGMTDGEGLVEEVDFAMVV